MTKVIFSVLFFGLMLIAMVLCVCGLSEPEALPQRHGDNGYGNEGGYHHQQHGGHHHGGNGWGNEGGNYHHGGHHQNNGYGHEGGNHHGGHHQNNGYGYEGGNHNGNGGGHHGKPNGETIIVNVNTDGHPSRGGGRS